MTSKEITLRFIQAFDIVAAEEGMTQTELAKKYGRLPSYISHLRKKENPQPDIGTLATFCIDYRISPRWLFTGHGDMRDPELLENLYQVLANIDRSQSQVIEKLLDGMLEVRARMANPMEELIKQAKQRKS